MQKRFISYVSAHGTGTKANDATESTALKHVFGANTDQIYVSSIKSMIGHTMGGASAIEAIACVLSIVNNKIVPTVNFNKHDPECLTNIVPNHAINHKIDAVLNVGIGFGGNIAVTAFGNLQ